MTDGDRLDDNAGAIPDNREFNVVSASDITFWVKEDLAEAITETATKKIIATARTEAMGHGFVLRPGDNAVSIVSLGHITFTDPITVSAGSTFAWIMRCPNFRNIVIRTSVANTIIRLLVV